jgi:hypothetical protein
MSLVGAAFNIQQAALAQKAANPSSEEGEDPPIEADRLNPPSLTILAVEEPEYHLAPHYLGRIMAVLRSMAESPAGQVRLTTHSPSIMSRIEPQDVRYLRLDVTRGTTSVGLIKLPPEEDEAHKFVREAVRAYPELYFARLVVLGEGDSEEIVLPRLAEARGLAVDRSFVSIVPLGGRHVNHFWKLLSALEIPFITLLDLDRERAGGGWGRIQYACEQLLKIGVPESPLLDIDDGDGDTTTLAPEALRAMRTWDVADVTSQRRWMIRLAEFDVFFSWPLDLDFMMLRAFSGPYRGTAPPKGGPRIPKEGDANREQRIKDAISAALKDGGTNGSTYSQDEQLDFFWYRNLFLGRGKPTTHILALAQIEAEDLAANAPKVLKRLVTRMKTKLLAEEQESADEG